MYDSRDYGIGCGGFPDIVIPRKRITIESLPGRSGSLTSTDDCYDSYTKAIECYMEDDVYKDLSWLSGSGKLVLSNELEREYDVTLKNNIELSQIATYWRNFILNFEVQPFKKSRDKKTLIYRDKEFMFRIGGNARTLPIIYLTGTGDIDLTINGKTFKIKNLKTTIMIDSELQVVMEGEENALPKTNGDFPELIPGLNKFQITGNLLNIKIKYQETYL
jgi:phage-related protein